MPAISLDPPDREDKSQCSTSGRWGAPRRKRSSLQCSLRRIEDNLVEGGKSAATDFPRSGRKASDEKRWGGPEPPAREETIFALSGGKRGQLLGKLEKDWGTRKGAKDGGLIPGGVAAPA